MSVSLKRGRPKTDGSAYHQQLTAKFLDEGLGLGLGLAVPIVTLAGGRLKG